MKLIKKLSCYMERNIYGRWNMKKLYIFLLMFIFFLCGCSRGIPFQVRELTNITLLNNQDQDKIIFLSEYQQFTDYIDQLNSKYNLIGSFLTHLEAYDEIFFTDYYLIIIYFCSSSSIRAKVNRVTIIENTASVELKIRRKRVSSDDLNQRCYFVEIEKTYDIIDASVMYN